MQCDSENAQVRRFRGILEYDGTEFHGFQQQAEQRTVQAELETSIGRVSSDTRVVVRAAGRTDSGVHASGQVIAFDLEWRHGVKELLGAINAHLPDDACLSALEYAEDGFDPRRAARWRRYEYRIYNAPVRSPLHARMSWLVWPKLDMQAMQAGARILRGEHDFATFGSPPDKRGRTVRTVREVKWRTEGQILIFAIEANAFLYHMVRSIVGTLRMVGSGQWEPDLVSELLASPDRSRCGALAPPQGLTLLEVKY